MTVSTAQVLDLETMQFEAGPTMQEVRLYCAATTLDAERVLVIGGNIGAGSTTTEVLSVADDRETRRRRGDS